MAERVGSSPARRFLLSSFPFLPFFLPFLSLPFPFLFRALRASSKAIYRERSSYLQRFRVSDSIAENLLIVAREARIDGIEHPRTSPRAINFVDISIPLFKDRSI